MVWIAALAILVACRKEEITIYSIPKETPPQRKPWQVGIILMPLARRSTCIG
jgi:hypothetical protein